MVKLEVEVTPRSKTPGVAGHRGDALRVRVSAAPIEGKANDEVIKVVAAFLGVPKAAVTILHGGGGRRKLLAIEGLTDDGLAAALARTAVIST